MFTNMQSYVIKTNTMYKDLIISIILGLLIGLSTVALVKSLDLIQTFHLKYSQDQSFQWYLLIIPIVSISLTYLKKNTLYFPAQIKQIYEDYPIQKARWNPLMIIYNYLGVCLSHLSGASLGREGANVMLNSGWIPLLRLDFKKWIPVATAVGFSTIIGMPWISLIFLIEMFTTSVQQKIFVLIAAFVASNITMTFKVNHILSFIEINKSFGFLEGILFCFCLGLIAGSLIKIYKRTHHYFLRNKYFENTIFKIFISFILVYLFNLEYFRSFQGLGLEHITNIMNEKYEFVDILFKLILTFFSIQVGLWGGEFIPFLFCGLLLGKNLATILNFDTSAGSYLGSYMFFAAASRLKWTSIFLTINLLGWTWIGWIYLLVSVTLSFAGKDSLYKNDKNENS